MKYITHKRYRGYSLDRQPVNIRYGTVLELDPGGFLVYEGKIIAAPHSQTGIEHFARDDDDRGLERGKLTHAIAFSPRGNGTRFTSEECDMLTREYPRFLQLHNLPQILFDDAFYDAEIDELQELANRLSIKIRR